MREFNFDELEDLDPELVALLPAGHARYFRVIPVALEDRRLVFLSEEALSEQQRESLRFLFRTFEIGFVPNDEGARLRSRVAVLLDRWFPESGVSVCLVAS